MEVAGWVILIVVIVLLLAWLMHEQEQRDFLGPPAAGRPRRGNSPRVAAANPRLAEVAAEALASDSQPESGREGGPNSRPHNAGEQEGDSAQREAGPEEESDGAGESSTDTFTAERRSANPAPRDAASQRGPAAPSPRSAPRAAGRGERQPAGDEKAEEEEDATNEDSVALETPQPFRGNGQYSQKEELCRQVLEDIYGLPFPKVRPDFLKNAATGRNLELDGYCHAVRVGFEFNGKQHYAYPNNFHKSSQEFMRQVQRDNYKYKQCKRLGIHLIVVPNDVPSAQIRDFITAQLPQRGRGVIYVNPKRS